MVDSIVNICFSIIQLLLINIMSSYFVMKSLQETFSNILCTKYVGYNIVHFILAVQLFCQPK